ncbi:carboxypeptidase-like regulatory domain-containing protein [Flavihumibacter petaseus]|uniref:Carboxypeptidase regulatory-like domain-containing protein n=1 Tax=Flavihumibacter petaseus NBRC 106054 TaxID=1220578 RepID=A0A0E9MZ42_9BACT|nr:carboxypeptidase-like regulatory domain-containing protein [Flavihumibacter petaseus]GAO42656.1 hypothetical protein FPE01S_01_16710 [Flavihumibacter petaseus NBRC 106054]
MSVNCKLLLATAIAALPLFYGCEKDEEKPSDAEEKGFVKGQVYDTKGNPLSQVEIVIDNTYLPNSYIQSVTDDQGKYSVSLSFGAWMAYAILHKTYNNKEYDLYLDSDTPEGFTQEGGVRNFHWKLSGARKAPLTGNYGGTILLTRAVGSSLFDSENIEYTLTPDGPLIDGSQGAVIVIHEVANTYKLPDIPIGRYTITAVYKAPGGGSEPVMLKNRYAGGAFSSGITVNFEPSSEDGNNMASIEYKEQ